MISGVVLAVLFRALYARLITRLERSGQMAENNETPSEEEAPKKGGIVSLLMWVVVAIASIGGGFATPYLVQNLSSEEAGKEKPPADPDGPTALVEFGEVTVNLNEARLNRFLRVNISLLIAKEDEQDFAKLMEENTAILKSWLLSYLAQKSMDDIRGATGQNRLRREIRTHFNSLMFADGPPGIREVLFQEFNVQ